MGAEEPPPVDSLAGPTSAIQGWTKAGQTELKADRQSMDAWLRDVITAADNLNAQLTKARGLTINEGVVGSFISAKMTAANLNQSADAIRQRLDESAKFVTALRDYSQQAYNRLFAQDGQ
ncbi:hypothetical protein JNN96_36955 [Mycobacterium sp. DSM 3803]|nr:hypothetical protein [Mycobacterium sp. DSM 3803]